MRRNIIKWLMNINQYFDSMLLINNRYTIYVSKTVKAPTWFLLQNRYTIYNKHLSYSLQAFAIWQLESRLYNQVLSTGAWQVVRLMVTGLRFIRVTVALILLMMDHNGGELTCNTRPT